MADTNDEDHAASVALVLPCQSWDERTKTASSPFVIQCDDDEKKNRQYITNSVFDR